MATKVKPCRIQATGIPQAGYVPKYVDEDTFQWGAGGGGGGSDIEYVTQAEYNALLPGAASDGKHYFIYTSSTPQPRTPGADTIAYYKFEGDANDYSGNGYDLTASGNVSYVTLNGKQVVYFQGANSNSTTRLETSAITLNSSPQTYSIRCRTNSNGSGSPYGWFLIQTFQISPRIRNGIGNANLSSYVNYCLYKGADYQREQTSVVPDRGDDIFHHIAITISPTECCFYRDGVKEGTFAGLSNSSYTAPIYIGCNDDTNYAFNGYIGETIIESKSRTAQEISDYYDQTKANYGIS